ncbi:hypothetical protein LTR56_007751 [Elasticomyces elasticus]|nr:hypothetical protein LTR56_007751 [Elasticomyces elasticus]KAK3661877.1 hypothetical protein LTR22_007251 [Elasticomyces elasticus]KAK4925610.1 hypothetical protein LTR49_007448 [Elasticomyces elasticus]KAK5748577.1 hypothetical protein LTS12_021351 [Elasticomyces elasticus]
MASTSKDKHVAIVADGDVIFNIGTPTTARLRVSSDVLIRASKVFAVLLGPRFREGSLDRNSQSPADIALLEDDAVAIEDLCRFLHGESIPELMEDLEPGRIYKLAIASDKYGCNERLRIHGQALLLGFWDAWGGEVDEVGDSALAQMAAAAYLFDHARAFSIATRHIIMDTNEEYSKLFEADTAHVFPVPAICR